MANKFVTEISARDKSKTAFRSFRGSLKNASKSLFSFKGALSGIATSVGAMRLADATKQAIQGQIQYYSFENRCPIERFEGSTEIYNSKEAYINY